MMRRGDTFLSRILLGLIKPPKKYQILGTEFSGTIEAASVVDGATTALFFLQEKANIQKGQKILINGASGSRRFCQNR